MNIQSLNWNTFFLFRIRTKPLFSEELFSILYLVSYRCGDHLPHIPVECQVDSSLVSNKSPHVLVSPCAVTFSPTECECDGLHIQSAHIQQKKQKKKKKKKKTLELLSTQHATLSVHTHTRAHTHTRRGK